MAYIKADTPQKQKWFDYLEELRQSGVTNMWGAAPYLRDEFPKDFPKFKGDLRPGHLPRDPGAVLIEWMKAHNDDSLIMKGPGSVEEETGF